jgi:hypothetical protein
VCDRSLIKEWLGEDAGAVASANLAKSRRTAKKRGSCSSVDWANRRKADPLRLDDPGDRGLAASISRFCQRPARTSVLARLPSGWDSFVGTVSLYPGRRCARAGRGAESACGYVRPSNILSTRSIGPSWLLAARAQLSDGTAGTDRAGAGAHLPSQPPPTSRKVARYVITLGPPSRTARCAAATASSRRPFWPRT